MSRRLRLLLACAVAALALAGWMAVSAWVISAALDPSDRTLLWAVLEPRMPLAVLAWIAGAGGLAWLIVRADERYVRAPARLQESARVLLAGSGSRPLEAAGGDACLQGLASVISELAAERNRLREEVDREIARANANLLQERNRLAGLLYGLAQSVVVCSLDGRIVLYNNRARLQFRALSQAPSAGGGAELIGIGRSIHGVLDPALVEQALTDIRQRLSHGAAYPSSQFITTTRGGQRLRVQVTAVHAGVTAGDAAEVSGGTGGQGLGGFVLILDHIGPGGPQVPDGPGPLLPAGGSRPEFFDFDLFAVDPGEHQLDDRPLTALAYTVFDTETTGLSPSQGDRIIQVGAARIVNGRLLRGECFEQLVDPGRSIPAAGIPIHGITPEMVAGKPPIGEVLAAFHAYAHDTVLVAHNAAFDMRFLQMQEDATGIVFRQPVLDTLLLSAVVHPNQKSHRLEDIAARLHVPVHGRHTAMGDAIVTAEIFLRLLPLLAALGIRTLREAREASQRTYYARVRY